MYLNQTKKMVTLDELSARLGVSRNNLIKVSNQLVKLGYVHSTRGRSGGLVINHNAGKQKLGVIVRSTESFHVAECFKNKNVKCAFLRGCALKHALNDALNAFLSQLDHLTLDDVTPA